MTNKHCHLCKHAIKKGQKLAIFKRVVVHDWCKKGNVKCTKCNHIFTITPSKRQNISNLLEHFAAAHPQAYEKMMMEMLA